MRKALGLLAAGEAEILAVQKLDRLSRSVADFAAVTQLATEQGWSLRILDLGLDMTSASGELMANVLATFAQFERRLVSDRTKAGLAAKRAAGVRLGRPPVLSEQVRASILNMRARGDSYARIAQRLTADGVPTARGGARWYPSAVYEVCTARRKLNRP